MPVGSVDYAVPTRRKTPSYASFVKKVGIELEGFVSQDTCRDLPAARDCSWHDDAGRNLGEMVTEPHDSVAEAFATLRATLAMAERNSDVYLTPYRPATLAHNQGQWQQYKPRYRALIAGLQRESPRHWHGVHRMTDTAALQINVSGDFDPFDADGTFLINVWNNIAPYVAARVHAETRLGKGHLAIWRDFANPNRFPQSGRWFADALAMQEYIASTPRLFCDRGNDVFDQPEEGECQSIECPTDLGVMWWFLRPKLNTSYIPYLELRFLPSMPLELGEYYATKIVDAFEYFLQWFHRHKERQSVAMTNAAPAYAYVNSCVPELVPSQFLAAGDWNRYSCYG